jgi:S1-C subfamily serine protease
MTTRLALVILALASLSVLTNPSSVFGQTRPKSKPSAPKQLTPQQIAQLAMPSVVFVVTLDAKGQPLKSGSAFFVKPHTLVTNLHVVNGASQIRVSSITEDRTDARAILYYGDAQKDLAILKVDGMDGTPLVLTIDAHNIGDRVFAVGNPKGLEGTFSEGIISGFRRDENVNLIQLTAPISPGSSGGPVLDDYGKVIGVAAAAIEGGQNLNFAIDLDDMGYFLLESAADKAPPGTISGGRPAKTDPPPRPAPALVDERGSMRGIKSVQVLVEPLRYETYGLTASQIKVDTELRLRKAGITVADRSLNLLYININLLQSSGVPNMYIYSLETRLEQAVAPFDRDENIIFQASTWSKEAVGTVGRNRITDLRTDVQDQVDAFINDYLAANPKR